MTKPKAVKPIENMFVLGGREFTIVPLADREDERAFDDGVEFAVDVVPVMTKLMSMQATAANYMGQSVLDNLDAEADKPEEAPKQVELGLDQIADLVNELDLPTVVRELGGALPKLVAFVCRGTDPTIGEREVKLLARRPWNPALFKALVLQIKADNLFGEIGEVKAALESFSA
jgi:hypothetical protein